MKYPNEIFTYSPRPYKGIQDINYPFHDRTVTVTYCGRMCFKRKKINLSRALAVQDVGIKETEDGINHLGRFLQQKQKMGSAG